jgi:DNA-binding NtrC family response regulator
MSRPNVTIEPDRDQGGATEMALKLVVVAGPDEGMALPLVEKVAVGSDPEADLVLHDPAVSRRHIVFARVLGRVVVKDVGSRNGTFIGGTRVVEAEVPVGAVLVLGNSAISVQPRWYHREVAPSTSRRFGELRGESVAMRELFAVLERVSATDATVLALGETGTGKEVVARSIHAASPRAAAPFVVFDCGAVPRDLAESELFGHKKGAFSGAVADRQGAFQRAHGGTVFLDEIGELPLELQPRLLRVLETGEIRSVGDDMVRKIDVRVVAATNRELTVEARQGRFRQDLLYRLQVVQVRVAPLRERPEDIAGLVAHFLDGKIADCPAGITGPNLSKLMAYSWPGNARELRNALARAVALAPRSTRFADLVFNFGAADHGNVEQGLPTGLSYKLAKQQVLENFDRAYLEALMEKHGGNLTQAAAAAGISRKHIYELLKRNGKG